MDLSLFSIQLILQIYFLFFHIEPSLPLSIPILSESMIQFKIFVLLFLIFLICLVNFVLAFAEFLSPPLVLIDEFCDSVTNYEL